MELDRVPDQVLDKLANLGRIGLDHGQRIVSDRRVALVERYLQVRHGQMESGLTVGGGELRTARADAGVFEQVLDQGAHPQGAVQGVAYKLVRIGIELSLVSLRE